MKRTTFNDGWEFRPKVSQFAEVSGRTEPFRPVTVPHDAMLGGRRAASEDGAGAYFPGGVYEYRKMFHVMAEDERSRVLVEFEGVYRDAMVYVNGSYVTQQPYGYTQFRADVGPYLRHGAANEIRVEARTHQDSRWYTGAGIYRDTWLLRGGPVHIAPEGVRVTTLEADRERAEVEVAVRVENDGRVLRTVRLAVEVADAEGRVVAECTTPVTVEPGQYAIARRRMHLREPALWGPDRPALHTATVAVEDGQDTETVTFGIRTLRLDPDNGLRINGAPVELRGADDPGSSEPLPGYTDGTPPLAPLMVDGEPARVKQGMYQPQQPVAKSKPRT
ncbi:sugar-binding domain-containing protein [Streptomyces sp. NPDC047939]|uniref:glycoside hydrolase family 2 protein n=1 Tax=Streptomyces sp. NPDC047939 TaxID=3155381 RepID=UPI0034191B5B